MTLKNGNLWSIPIVLDVSKQFVDTIEIDEIICLKDKEGFLLAYFKIKEIWKPNLIKEAELVYGTNDTSHPGVNYLLNIGNPFYISGDLKKVEDFPHHYDYRGYRHSPKELKATFKSKRWTRIVAFQTRNPLHKAHVEMTKIAMDEFNLEAINSSGCWSY